MKDRSLNFLKKYWLSVWCLIAALSLFGIVAAAEYTFGASAMKRVVVATSDQGKMLSSNRLVENGERVYSSKLFNTDSTNSRYDVDVLLWNYSLNNISKWYPLDIEYTISLALKDASGENFVSASQMEGKSVQLILVTKGENDADIETVVTTLDVSHLTYDTPVVPNASLPTLVYDPSEAAQDHYILRFIGWDLEKDTDICVLMIAEPNRSEDASKYRELPTNISAVIGIKPSKNSDPAIWQSYLAEDYNDIDAIDCSGYNLILTGSGKAKITISWNTDYLECNKNFNNNTVYSFASGEVTGPTVSGNIKTLIINADTASDSNNNRNRYDIQFYKKNANNNSGFSNWNFFDNNGAALNESIWLSVETENIK